MIQLVVYAAVLGVGLAGAQAPETGAAPPSSRLERTVGEVTAVDALSR